MDAFIGVGVPARPVTGGFDFWLPLYLVLALFLIRFVVGARVTVASAAAAFVCGTVWFWLVGAFGVIPAAASVVLVAIVSASIRRRLARGPRCG